MFRVALSCCLILSLAGCAKTPPPVPCPPEATEKAPPPEPGKPGECRYQQLADPEAAAGKFLAEVEQEVLKLWVYRERVNWIKATHITFDTELVAAKADEAVMAFIAEKSAEAVCRFGPVMKDLPAKMQRKFKLLRLSLSLPAPRDPAKRAELAQIATFMDSTYGKGKYCPPRLAKKKVCWTLGQMSETLAKSRNYDDLLEAWQGWRTISRPMRDKFVRYVELGNEGARELGFSDLGDLWKSRYDMPAEAFAAETDRLWEQVKPLYSDLHCYVRAKLQARYGEDKVPSDGPIPAHLLGNMWSQEWANLYPMVAPTRARGLDVTRALKAKKTDPVGMVRYAENFFVSLGLKELPDSFWKRSMFVKPRDREVVCHASAWDVDWVKDLRIKMCIKINGEDFTTIHHELGHNYYQYAYRTLDPLFRDSANDGFHEALGDTIALSVTPSYMVKVGLFRKAPKGDLNPLMQRALEKVAFLPFGLLIDRWRWDVFSGKIKPADYNKSWWAMRTRYQGIKPPVERTEEDFDPGAKYHIPANVPYTRYFLAAILQYQFHRALCRVAGHKGPLHTCSIYQNKAAGKRLAAMMEMGLSRPWPEALRALTGQDKMDATAILDYYKPLHAWLKKQNKGRKCGW
jgi:peptidyl-dipeptidase A